MMPATLEQMERLVTAAASGDADAFGRIVGATSGMVSSVALAIVRDVELSQEIAQDVFLSAWRDLSKLRNSASFLPWLRQMTRNRAHHALRSRVRSRRWFVQLTGNDNQAEAVPDARADAAEHLLAAEQHAVLREALASLPDETREVLILFYREGQSAAQVASLLEISEDAVKKRLSRARASLRGTMIERLGDTLIETRPGTAFTAAIMAGLPLTVPLTTSAAAAGTAKMTSALTTSSGGLWAWIVALVMPALGLVIGSVGGLLGMAVGTRVMMKKARDDRERQELRWYLRANFAAILAFSVGFEISLHVIKGAWFAIANMAVFTIAILWLSLWWFPRIVERRLAAEMAEDPVGAERRRRRERWGKIVAVTVAMTLAWVVVFYQLLALNRL